MENRTLPATDASLQQIIFAITQAQTQLYNIFANALVKNLRNQAHMESSLQFFNDFWNELAGVEQFDSLAELEKYYTQLKKNLSLKMQPYFQRNNLSAQAQDKELLMFKVVADIYMSTAKQAHYLQIFARDSVLLEFANYISDFELVLAKLTQALPEINLVNVNDKLNGLEQTNQYLCDVLRDYGFNKTQQTKNNKNGEINSNLKLILENFPKVKQINSVIDAIKLARDKSNEKELASAQQNLNELLQLFRIKNNELIDASIVMLDQYKSLVAALVLMLEILEQKLNELATITKKLTVSFEKIYPFLNIRNSENSTKRGVDALREFDLTLKQTWPNAALLKTVLHNLADKIQKFNEPCINQMNTFTQFEMQQKRYEDQLQQTKIVHKRGQLLLEKSKNIYFLFTSALANAEYVLASFQFPNLSHREFLKKFFNEHKLKLLFGGLGGIGSCVLIAFLAGAFTPLSSIMLAIAGSVLGSSLAGGVGLAQDAYQEKIQKEGKSPHSLSERSHHNKKSKWDWPIFRSNNKPTSAQAELTEQAKPYLK